MINRKRPEPLHYQVKQWLKKQIEQGKYGAGIPLPTELALMKKFSLSRGTIRKAYDTLAQENLISRNSGKGTFIKRAASIGIVVPSPMIFREKFDPSWEINLGILNGILSTACMANTTAEIINYRDRLLEHHRDKNGFIVLDIYEELLRELESQKTPYVFVYNLDETPDFVKNGVLLDLEDAFFQAPNYLTKLGHKKIAFIGYTDTVRISGYKMALRENGLEFDDSLVEPTGARGNIEDGYEAAKRLFSRRRDMDAIFCTTDLRAIGCMQFLKENKIRIPDDISVMGFDNINLSTEQDPPLTTFDTMRFQRGEKAAEKAIEWINDANRPCKRNIQKGKIVIRKSTKRRIK